MCNPCAGCEEIRSETTEIRKSSERSCTDVLFLLLFLASCVVSVGLLSAASSAGGHPDNILLPTDMSGVTCGEGVNADLKYGAFPNPLSIDAVVCLASCDETSDPETDKMARLYPTSDYLNYCLPLPSTDGLSVNSTMMAVDNFSEIAGFSDSAEKIDRAVADLYTSAPLILGSAVIALILTFFFLYFLESHGACVIYMCLGAIVGGALLIVAMLLKFAEDASNGLEQDTADAVTYLAYAIAIVTAIFVLVISCLQTQIRIAIEVCKEAAKAVLDMKMILLFPLVPFFLSVGYMLFWIYEALYIFSVGDELVVDTPDSVGTYGEEFLLFGKSGDNGLPRTMITMTMNDQWKGVAVYFVFHLLWVMQFLYYAGYCVFAGAAADWYFTPYDEKMDKRRGTGPGELSNYAIRDAVGRTCRYHLGTVAVTSLIIAIIQTIRAVVNYIDLKTKGNPPNRLQRAVMCCIKCCLRCVESFMDKVNKNALVWTAIYGDNFCHAACSSFGLIWRNLFRVAALSVVSDILLFVGKVCVTLATTGLCLLVLTNVDAFEISTPFVPCLVILVFSYAVSSVVFAVFDAVINTTFVCFLLDAETNSDAGETMLASKSLQALVGKYKDKSKEMASEQKSRRTGVNPEQNADPEPEAVNLKV